jgi:hypothetical protein
MTSESKFRSAGSQVGGVFFCQFRQMFQGKHEGISLGQKSAVGESGDGREGVDESRVGGCRNQ